VPLEFEAGSSLGPYEIIDRLGAGGMGEVYRARDPRLGREVAIKVLSPSGPVDGDRLRRFDQEARAAGALSHPNILVVFDTGSHEGIPYVVFELLQGETLARHIARGDLSPRKSVDYAVQIAEGLSAAHNQGIIHRDLKPANIFVTNDGRLKILDFGLAKLRERPDGAVDSGSTADALTEPGVGLGTAGYMSPEQIEGLPLDHRSDIFSFGAVLYEMLSGRKAFPGRLATQAMTAVLSHDPPPLGRVHRVSLALARIVHRCLEKRPSERFQSAHDLALALRAVSGAEEAHGRRLHLRHWAIFGVALVTVAAMAITAVRLQEQHGGVPGPVGSFHGVPLTTFSGREFMPALSPDGNFVAFVWDGEDGQQFDVYNRPIGSETTLRLTTDPADEYCPAWSPDGRSVAFIRVQGDEGTIFTVPASGGVQRRLRSVRPWFGSALSWSPDGKHLLFSDSSSPEAPFGTFLLSLDSLETRRLTEPPPSSAGDAFPVFSPDGQTVAFARLSVSGSGLMGADISIVPAAGGIPRIVDKEPLLAGGLDWTADGRELVVSSSRTGSPRLWRIDVAGGEPRPLLQAEDPLLANTTGAEAVAQISRALRFSISRTGNRLVYSRGLYDTDIWRVEVPGRTSGARVPTKLIATTRLEEAPQFSPDGTRIAFASTRSTPNAQIWTCDQDGTSCVQLTSFDVPCGSPRWSPDGRQIAFDAPREGLGEIYLLEVDTQLSRRLTTTPSDESLPSWSRDGRWIYFASNRTGSWQVWKMPVAGGLALPVTSQGGFAAQESADGRLLYYSKPRSAGIWRAPVEGGVETLVMDLPQCWGYWALSEEGVYVLDANAKAGPTIQLFPFSTRQPVSVARLAGGPACGEAGLAVSPDGRWLLYVDTVQGSDVVLVEDFK